MKEDTLDEEMTRLSRLAGLKARATGQDRLWTHVINSTSDLTTPSFISLTFFHRGLCIPSCFYSFVLELPQDDLPSREVSWAYFMVRASALD
jgi:hypothetical protein